MHTHVDVDSAFTTVAVDVVLLAVVVALHVTRKEENLKLLLVVLIVVHVIATTTRGCSSQGSSTRRQAPERLGTSTKGATSGSGDTSDAEYQRQFTSPDQLSKTLDVLPTTSRAANSKLAQSRSRFFRDIIDK